jgi:hypothetical protein
VMVEQFVFEGAEEGLDEGIIVAVAFSAHRKRLGHAEPAAGGKRRWQTAFPDQSGR